VYASYIESKKPESVTDQEAETVDESDLEKMEQSGWTGFHKDENGIFVYDYLVRGFIRNAANVLKDEIGIKNLRSKITDYVFVFPRRVYLGGKKQADGVFERPIRVMLKTGPRVTLIRSDFVSAGTELSFTIKVLPHKEITVDVVKRLLEYGQFQGFGQFRNGSYGRFEVVDIGNA
jgi:hypothetical protein